MTKSLILQSLVYKMHVKKIVYSIYIAYTQHKHTFK